MVVRAEGKSGRLQKEELMRRFVRIAVVIAVICACSASCGGSKKPGHPTVDQIFEDCATVDVGRTVPEMATTVLGWVLQVLQAGVDGYESELGRIGLSYGEDVLACAAKAARDTFAEHSIAATSAPTSAVTPALSRTDAFIAKHGWIYK
jgi:hypothetical protein